jgi:hypothetical protein
MNVYLVSGQKHFSDITFPVGVFSTKKLAVKYIRQNKKVRYSKTDDWYDDTENGFLYMIARYRLNSVDES